MASGRIRISRRVCAAVAATGLLAGMTACSGLGFGHRSLPLGSGPANIVTPLRIPLIDEPQEIGREYVYPEGATRQAFAWGGFGGEWRVRPANRPHAHAGFAFRTPRDMTPLRDSMVLSFRMRPMEADVHLSVALVDGARTPERVMVDMPLASRRIFERRGWGLYAIPLADFADQGVVLDGGDTGVLDWSDIAEIRLIARSDRGWDQAVSIRNLQFGQIPWALRLKMAAGRPAAPPS